MIVAVVLAVYARRSRRCCSATPRGARCRPGSFLTRTWATVADAGDDPAAPLLYAVGFGGFVAFSVYLPTYLVNAYGLTQADAALRTAGFVVLAVVMRPVGGWLSDRFDPAPVLTGSFADRGGARRARRGRARR